MTYFNMKNSIPLFVAGILLIFHLNIIHAVHTRKYDSFVNLASLEKVPLWRVPGIGPHTAQRLKFHHIRTAEQLYRAFTCNASMTTDFSDKIHNLFNLGFETPKIYQTAYSLVDWGLKHQNSRRNYK